MQAWIGNVIGSFIGLLAILIGALWNSHLTRKRDRLIRNEEAAALRAALAAELSIAMELTAGRLAQAVLSHGSLSPQMLQALKPINLVMWPKLCDKLGWLDASLAQDVIKSFSLLELHMSVLSATVDEMVAGDLDRSKHKARCQMFAQDIPGFRKAIKALGGEPPQGLMFPEFGV